MSVFAVPATVPIDPMSVLNLLAPAKINLCLHILGRRENGYHNLAMLMEKVSLYDQIGLEKIPEGIELIDSGLGFPPEKNLAYRAAKSLHEVSASSCGVRIRLSKNIPMGGGLGGGSSDAATVLKGLNQLWGLDWPVERLAEIGVKLGADVPFFLYEGPALVEGIGDKVMPQRKLPKLWIILLNPGISVETAWAYRQWDDQRLTQQNHSVSVHALRSFSEGGPRSFKELVAILHNDFEEIVFAKFPEIKAAKENLLKAGAAGALMSGSGATASGLFETEKERDRALKKMMVGPKWQVFTAEN